MHYALQLVSPFIYNKTVLDLGCGSGIFCFKLLKRGAGRVIGIDFSINAIQKAKERAMELKVMNRCEFICANVVEIDLPKSYITTSLGLLDYLNKEEIQNLFKKLKSPYFLFTFLQRGYRPFDLLHRLYLRYQGCPGSYRYDNKVIKKITTDAGYTSIYIKNGIVYSLPPQQ